MSDFFPYKIVHWRLEDLSFLPKEKGNHYICCWWKNMPIGHVWLDDGRGRNTMRLINDAIQPTLDHYLSLENINVALLLSDEKYDELNIALEKYFSGKQPNASPAVSVIICTRNRPGVLKTCLEHLIQCDGDFEIIVVDNSPGLVETKNVVQQFSNVRYVAENRPGLDIARNTGAKNAHHDIVAYTDDDVIVPVNWIKNISEAFHDPLTMAVTGLVIPYELETEAEYIFEKDWSFNKGYLPKKFDHRYFSDHKHWGPPVWEIGAGANMAFRKKVFQIAGYFDERLDAGAAGCSGDSEMWFRILAEGWNCEYLPHIVVFHQHRKTLPELRNQLFNYMKGHVAALLIQEENYPGTGNLRRVKKGLPGYYLRKLPGLLSKNNFTWSQIKGCVAGWKYYNKHKKRAQKDIIAIGPQNMLPQKKFDGSLVSVIITCYNLGHYLGEAIESVLQQTYSNTEILVVDDGSTDNTAEVCNQYNVHYIKTARVGLSAARNTGTNLAQGDYLIFLDADDFLYPEAIEINGYFFDYYPDVIMVSGAHTLVDHTGEISGVPPCKVTFGNNYIALLEGNYIAMEGAAMYRKEIFDHFHFDTSLQACEDYDLNLKIARSYPIFGHDKIVAAYRRHGNNMSANKMKMKTSALKVLNRHAAVLKNEEEKKSWHKGIQNWKNYYQ